MKKIYMMLVLLLSLLTTGAFSQTNYYSKAAATDFNDVNSWGANTDGTGAAPGSISSADFFTVSNSSAMNLTGNASVGKLTISSGSLSISANTLTVAQPSVFNTTFSAAGGTLNMNGGNLIVNGNFNIGTGGKFNQIGGTISVDGNNGGVAATSVASGTYIVNFAPTANTDIALSGGTFVIVDPHVSTSYCFQANIPTAGACAATGTHTFKFGDGVSTDNGGANGFSYYSWQGSGIFKFRNVVLETVVGGTNRFFYTSGTFFNTNITGDLTINAGAEFRNAGTNVTTGASYFGGNIINNGTFTSSAGVFFADMVSATATTLTVSPATNAQTVSGSGIFRNTTGTVTANFATLIINNTSSAGVVLPGTNNVATQPANSVSVSTALTFTAGKLSTSGSASVVLGNSSPSAGTLNYTAGGFISGTTFGRWWTAGGTGSTIAAGTDPTAVTSRYPFITAGGVGRSAWIARTTPTAGGVIGITYNESSGTNSASITDGAYTVNTVSKDNWAPSILTGSAAAASYTLAIVAPGVYITTPDATSRVVRAADAVGTYQLGTATPGAQRIGLTAAELASTFYMGINFTACSGPINGGTSATTVYNLCAGGTQVLTVTGASSGGTGLSYQWEVSPDGSTGWVNVTGGSGANTTSYTTPAYISGSQYYRLNVTCSNGPVTNYSNVIQVTGPGAPATQASAFAASSITGGSATLGWTNGSGNNRSVYINSVNSFTDPVTPSSPGTAATAWANAGQQLVYDGSGTSVAVTALAGGTTYYVRIYEGTKCTGPAAWYYNTGTATNNPGNFTTLTPPANDLVCNAMNLVVDDPTPSCVNTALATITASDPDINSCSTPNNTVWYKFTPTVSGVHTIVASVPAASTDGESAWLFMYTVSGTCPATLTFTPAGGVSCTAGPSAATAGTTTNVATTALTAGTTYYVYVDGNSSDFGDVCLRVVGPQPMTYVSSTATQAVVTNVTAGSTNNQIIGLQVVVSGTLSPLTVTDLTFNTNGTTAPGDLTGASVYYTGTTSSFSTATPFGSLIANPNGSYTVTGSQAMTGAAVGNATNYFWVAYNVPCTATPANLLDAEITGFTMGSAYTPTVTAPAGSRPIAAFTNPTPSTSQPSSANVPNGAVNAQVLQVSVAGSVCLNNISQLNFTNASSAAADIAKARVYYTTTSTFSTASQFGNDVIAPGATFSVTNTGATVITPANSGTLYFWLVYDIDCAAPATPGNFADASFAGMVTNLATLTAGTANPSGTRTIIVASTGDNINSAPAVVLGLAGGNPFDVSGKSLESGEPSPLLHTQPNSTNGVRYCNYSWGSAAGGTQWYKLTVPTTGYGSSGNLLIRATTPVSSPSDDTQLALWKFPNIVPGGGCGTTPNFTGVLLLAANDDAFVTGTGYTNSGTNNSIIRVHLTPGSVYYIQIDGFTTSLPNGDLIVEELGDPAGKNVSNSGIGDIHNPTGASDMLFASYEVIGDDGWTYYYNNGGTSTTISDDKLILELNWSSSTTYLWNGTSATGNDLLNHVRRDPKSTTAPSSTGPASSTGSDAFVVWSGRLAASAASADLKPTAPYVNPSAAHWWMFNKFWNVFPNQQPITPVGVRFFYSDADYTALNAAVSGGGGTVLTAHSQMQFVKFTKSASTHYTNAEVDPASGQAAISASTAINLTWINTDAVQPGINQAQFNINTFSGGGGGSTGAPLFVVPVSLAYFNGVKQTSGNLLNWKIECTSGVNIILERSGDKVNFKGINTQNATADRCLTPFNYTDASPLAGYNYYRLKTISPDGIVKYSNIVMLINKDKGFELVNLVPNPVKDMATLNMSSAKAGKVELIISDVTGKLIIKQTVSVIAGSNTFNINFATLSAGTYQITAVTGEEENKTIRFVKY